MRAWQSGADAKHEPETACAFSAARGEPMLKLGERLMVERLAFGAMGTSYSPTPGDALLWGATRRALP